MNLNEYQNYHETKSHTTAEFPYNTYLCSIPKDFPSVPLHWHAELELIVIKKGRGIVSADLERRSVTSGDIILIRPRQLHSIEQDQSYIMEYENIILKPPCHIIKMSLNASARSICSVMPRQKGISSR